MHRTTNAFATKLFLDVNMKWLCTAAIVFFCLSQFASTAIAQGWSQLSPSGGPPVARQSHTAVFNAASDSMTVFAGAPGTCCGPGSQLNDVWVLSSADGLGGTLAWTQL